MTKTGKTTPDIGRVGLATNQSGGYWTKNGTAARSYLKKVSTKKPAPKKKVFDQKKFTNTSNKVFGLYGNSGGGM